MKIVHKSKNIPNIFLYRKFFIKNAGYKYKKKTHKASLELNIFLNQEYLSLNYAVSGCFPKIYSLMM